MFVRGLFVCLFACLGCSSGSPAAPRSDGSPPASNSDAAGTEVAPDAPSGDAGVDDATDEAPPLDADAGAAMTFDFDGCAAGSDSGDFPDDVGAALRGKCHACHGQPLRHGAPFPLVNYENVVVDLRHATIPIWQRMSYVIQPGSIPHMPLSGPPLTDAEMRTLDDWFARCAPPVPEGTGADLDTRASVEGGPVDAALPSDDGGGG